MYVHVNSLSCIYKERHPPCSYRAGIAICLNVKEGIIQTVYYDVGAFCEVNSSRRDKIKKRNIGYRIHSEGFAVHLHTVKYDTLYSVCERLIGTGASVEVHIKDLGYRLILVLRLQNVVAALSEIRPRVLFCSLKHSVDLAEIIGSLEIFKLEN